MTLPVLVGAASLLAWLYLLFCRGGFWRCLERDDAPTSASGRAFDGPWPRVVAIVPARDEAALIARSLGSLLAQDYPGQFTVTLVDDQSTDDTASIARRTAQKAGAAERLTVIGGSEPPPGWTGKLWAMAQGFSRIDALSEPPDYVLFTDADVAYAPHALRRLVARACFHKTALASLMVKLHCEQAAERMFIPAFIFFFQKLYPFAWVNDENRRTAAAAGGCMLVRPETLRRAGGLEAIRGALIDDCALGALMKTQGPVWIGLTESACSLRAASTCGDVRQMVARSAYAQLHYSPLLLAGAMVGMGIVYVVPPVTALLAEGTARILGLLAWGAMTLSFVPVLRFYRVGIAWALALPVIAAAYMLFTLDSAVQHWKGRGGAWKGRFQAMGQTGTSAS